MTTLVTGATGFIGANVVRALLAAGAAVRVLTRHGSDTRNLTGLPVETVYGDVRDMASLDSLNQAAVTAARQAPHDAVAQLAADGIAGLYRLRAGTPMFPPRLATWFGKPTGMGYPALFEALAPLVAAGSAALWMRQMTLGPTPEFCLHSNEPVTLPPGFSGLTLPLTPVWTGKAR